MITAITILNCFVVCALLCRTAVHRNCIEQMIGCLDNVHESIKEAHDNHHELAVALSRFYNEVELYVEEGFAEDAS